MSKEYKTFYILHLLFSRFLVCLLKTLSKTISMVALGHVHNSHAEGKSEGKSEGRQKSPHLSPIRSVVP